MTAASRRRETPLLGGLAIFAGVLVASALFLNLDGEVGDRMQGVLAGGALIAVVGAIDDRFELIPPVKLAGQIVAARDPGRRPASRSRTSRCRSSAPSTSATPAAPLTVVGLVFVMNVVNFSDGIDGSRPASARSARSRSRSSPSTSSAARAGDARGDHRRRRARASWSTTSPRRASSWATAARTCSGCCSAASPSRARSRRRPSLALVFPLVVLAVPFLDTAFVVLKRMKYRRPVYVADQNHFHHRFGRIGFSQRRTVLYLYAWTICVAAFAVALRFVPTPTTAAT